MASSNAILLLCWMVLTALTWTLYFIQAHRLFGQFRARYPQTAGREIAHGFSTKPHPDKYFFCFRRRFLRELRACPPLWGLRRQVKFLAFVAFACMPSGALAIVLLIVMDNR